MKIRETPETNSQASVLAGNKDAKSFKRKNEVAR